MTRADLELLCIGNALVDVFARDDEEIGRHFGFENDVQHIPITKMREILPMLPELVVCSGGGAANAAKISGLLGIKSGFIGAVGDDKFGRIFRQDLEKAGVHTELITKQSPTGICLVLSKPDGTKKIAASPSAALELAEGDLNEEIIQRAHVVVLDGFMLERKALVRRVLELSDKHGTAVALDLSTTGLAYERAAEIITYTRAYPLIVFMNEDEAIAFYMALSGKTEYRRPDTGLGQEIINLFRDFTVNDIFPVLTVKLGIRGAIVFAGGNVFREETIPVIPLETTGAGDTFCAAFLAAWIRDKSLSQCADFGNKAARIVLDVKGTHVNPKALKTLARQLK